MKARPRAGLSDPGAVEKTSTDADIQVMGLQDRDWFRDQPSAEWNGLVRGSDESPHARRTSGAAYAPRRRSRFVLVRGCAIAAAIVLVVFVAWDQREAVRRAYASVTKHTATPAPKKHSRSLARGDGLTNIVHLKTSPGLDRPAKVVTKWGVAGSFGRVTVYVPVGETPRKALTVALAQRGYQVVR